MRSHFILLLFISIAIHAQTPAHIDSLLHVLESTDNDSLKVRAINQAAFYFLFNNPEKARMLLQEGKKYASANRLPYSYNQLLNTTGLYFHVLQVNDSAKFYLETALQHSRENNWPDQEEKSLNNLGMSNLNSGKFSVALEYFSAGYGLIKTNQPENFAGIGKYLSNIGLVYQELKQFNTAIDYHKQALELREKYSNANDQAISNANLGVCYKSLNITDKAIEHYSKAIELAKVANSMRMYYALHDNLGNLYLDKKDYIRALPLLLTALSAPESLGKNPKSDLSVLSNLTNIYVHLNQPQLALVYAKKGLAILDEHPELERYAPTLLKSSAQAHYMLQQPQEGQKLFERYDAIRDSVFSQQNANAIAELQVKYETEKKEQQIVVQQAQLEEQQAINQRNLFLAISLLLLLVFSVILIVFIVSRNKRKAQLMHQDQQLLVKQTQINAALASQEAERKRVARDLHDGFGQLISALRLHLDQLLDQGKDYGARDRIFEKTEHVIEEMHTELRNIAFNLMPAILIQSGLPAALKELAARLSSTGNLQVTATDFGLNGRLNELQEINLYRITQEWINNILKYNSPTKINIQLVQHEHSLTYTIEDDGKGFDREALEKSTGNGWRNIQTRLNLISGKLDLDTQPDVRGSTLIIELPTHPEPVEQAAPLSWGVKNTA
ncbi:MAG: tetratricopeptide repeat protein [Cyclobacteriaceae bacterium]|nr:tetratricopeptide repeat protein [Cyclobacteriaceae bacterium]